MELKLYSIRDTKVGFMSPFAMNNDELLLREVRVAVNDPKPNICNTNIEDKEVWCLGSYDDKTGKLTSINPYMVSNMISLKIVEVKDDGTKN